MKRVWLIAAVFALVAATLVFAAVSNVDRYRPWVEKKLSQVLDRPVSVQKIALGWRGGLTLSARGIAVGDASAPEASAESIDAAVDLAALFSKKVVIRRLFVKEPLLWLVKTPSGVRLGEGTGRPAPVKKDADAGAPSWRIDLFRMERGEVSWTDLTDSPPLELAVREVDITARNVDLKKGFEAEGSFALFSKKANVAFKARMELPAEGSAGTVRRLEVEADMGKMDGEELYRAVPALGRLGLREPPAGVISLAVEDAPLTGFPGRAKAELAVKNGRFSLKSLPAPLESIELAALFDGPLIRLQSFSADYAGGRLGAEGTLEGLAAPQLSWGGRAAVKGLPVDALLPSRPQGAPRLQGNLSVDFEGSARGSGWPEISQTLSGRGRLTLENGIILNLNATRTVVEKLAQVPGIGNSVGGALTPGIRARLGESYTALAPFATAFEARDGALILPSAQVDTSDFTLVAAGYVGLKGGYLNLQTRLFLSRDLSAGAARVVPEIAALADANGRLEVPIRVSGTVGRPSIAADAQSIAARVAMSRGQELITGLLQKKLGKNQGAAGSSLVSSTEGNSSSYEQILKNLF